MPKFKILNIGEKDLPIYVNPDHVDCFEPYSDEKSGKTQIYLTGSETPIVVNESVSRVQYVLEH